MARFLKILILIIALIVALGAWYIFNKQPQRSGEMTLSNLQAPVTVRYDERGVPHIQAQHESDMYRALGYVHAQDRLFQMEMVRRLARGELAAILGPKLLSSDKLFRSLGIREHADNYAKNMDVNTPANKALAAYLDGINQYQNNHPAPLEFDILGIKKRPFTAKDSVSVAGYMAYSFAAAFRTEPVLTYIRDQLGSEYLEVFDLDWHPTGVIAPQLLAHDWQNLNQLAQLSQQAVTDSGLALFEGSNAWAVSGSRTASGKPLLAGDPHIGFAVPSVWYEAHLSYPGFELYGHHQALSATASLGHNLDFGWSLTMFQNDDIDLIAEKLNPDNDNQVWYQGKWVELKSRSEQIEVKGTEPVTLTLRRSPHGPIINDALGDQADKTPIAMWWAFLETQNPILEGFYQLNRAETLEKARAASEKIHAPGLNIVWANAKGDIGWWAAAKLPLRPKGVNPNFILDGSSSESDKLGFLPFSANPQEENPDRGYIVSANYQPVPDSGIEVPGYYNLPARGIRLNQRLADNDAKWDTKNSQALQLDAGSGYAQRLLKPLLPLIRVNSNTHEQELLQLLGNWNGDHQINDIAPTLFNQLVYQLAYEAMQDEMGEDSFKTLLKTRVIDFALPRLAADAQSAWWDNRNTADIEDRAAIVNLAWQASLEHLRATLGVNTENWKWGAVHTLTHGHPLGQQKPLDKLFNVGQFAAPGGHETPNNLSHKLGPAPWQVIYGPSTRRLIDFAQPSEALGTNPVGQSGVLFDQHYHDQAESYIKGQYIQQHFSEANVAANTQSTLRLVPTH
ncbi:penicillin acylase family protein [Paraglaciecola arctica]|uniref:penicillin acylase family protein n=1 Tax=Paraglaciecola arctica TaxID=1128911 RepID=UPI001C06DD3A|nr:penicillin acylase family protein [Paraglaciecola arctica]MBU3003670.1 penicillin acylase family protein [Paraglaciecola arctica]